MADAISTIRSTPVVAGAARAGASASASSSSSATAETTSVAVQQVQRLSPTLKSDPIAGVLVTQYLTSDGTIQSQIPSAAALAYLRAGLDANGLPIERPNQVKNDNNVVA